MRKNLIAVLVTLSLGSAAAMAVIATTASAQAPAPRNPVMLAQATPPNNARNNNGRAFTRPNPADRTARRAEFCQEAYARAAGRFAYLEARLGLSGAQTGAFNRWRDLRLATAKRMAADCAARPNSAPGRGARGGNTAMPPSPVERLTREETRLQRRLADIQAERPALDALYTSLNANQRRLLARAHGGFGRGGMRGRMGMSMRGGRGGDGNMMFRRGPMNGGMGMQGPMGRGPMGGQRGPGNQPPPPPPPSQFPQ